MVDQKYYDKINAAQNDLGELDHGQLVDLLLDNFMDIDHATATAIVKGYKLIYGGYDER